MTDAAGHFAPGAHPSSDHGAALDAHDGHDGDEPLGPIDLNAWVAGILGVAIGLLTALCFVLATAGLGAY